MTLKAKLSRLLINVRQQMQLVFTSLWPFIGKVLPDFICIGAPRCGTTWLHKQLSKHQALYLPRVKEIHFFDEVGVDRVKYFNKSFDLNSESHWRWYYMHFNEGTRRIKGDITPTYGVVTKDRIRLIAEKIPHLRVVCIIRNPIDRAWSGAGFFLNKKHAIDINSLPKDEVLKWTMLEGRLKHGKYREIISNWESVFPLSQMHYIFFDDIKESPDDVINKLCNFLGLDSKSMYVSRGSDRDRNTDYPKVAMPEYVRKHLEDYYVDDIRFLEKKFARDLSHWLTSEHVRAGSNRDIGSVRQDLY